MEAPQLRRLSPSSSRHTHPTAHVNADTEAKVSVFLLTCYCLLASPNDYSRGTRIHYIVQFASVLAFVTGFLIIEINKGDHARLTSTHGILGLITYILIVLQAIGGVAQYFLPTLVFGSVDRGKRIYKYHRLSGYALLILELATFSFAIYTGYNVNFSKIPLAPVLVSSFLVLLGLGLRVRKQKLGL